MKRLLKILLVCCAVFVAAYIAVPVAIKATGTKVFERISESGRYRIDFYSLGRGYPLRFFYEWPFFVKIYDLEHNGRHIYTSNIAEDISSAFILEGQHRLHIGLGIQVPLNR